MQQLQNIYNTQYQEINDSPDFMKLLKEFIEQKDKPVSVIYNDPLLDL
jgi:hypothetical protein